MLLAIIVIMMDELKQQCKSHCMVRKMIIPSVSKVQISNVSQRYLMSHTLCSALCIQSTLCIYMYIHIC